MSARSVLSVVVLEVPPCHFAWRLMMRPSSGGLGECVAMSLNHFHDYDQALDAGFLALYQLRTGPSDGRDLRASRFATEDFSGGNPL